MSIEIVWWHVFLLGGLYVIVFAQPSGDIGYIVREFSDIRLRREDDRWPPTAPV